MNIYGKQLAALKQDDLKETQTHISMIIIKENYEDDVSLTIESLYSQIFLEFEFVVVDWSDKCALYTEWGTLKCSVLHEKKIETLYNLIAASKSEHIIFVRAGNFCAPHMLLEFANVLEDYDAIYSDEAVYVDNVDNIYQMEIKPDFSDICFCKHLFTGQSVLWEKKFLLSKINEVVTNSFDTMLRELFILLYLSKRTVYHIPLILLIKHGNQRNCDEEKKLIPLLQKNLLEKGVTGEVIHSTSYNKYCFEINDNSIFDNVSFIICTEDCPRTCSLLYQLHEACGSVPIVVGMRDKEAYRIIQSFCVSNNYMQNITLLEIDQPFYSTAILQLAKVCHSDIQIIIRDAIQWCNKSDIKRLLQCFVNKKIMGASPQIATATTNDGAPPRIIYAGASVSDASLYTELFKGRLQNIYGELDLVWTNREISLLSSFCFAVRKELWDYVGDVHPSIKTPEQFTMEVSLILRTNKMLCEYAAQSSFWLGEVLGNGNCLKVYSKSDCYWHWLYEYGKQLEDESLNNTWLYRSWKTHLNTSLQLNIRGIQDESLKKRILIYTHELSLTGAPIVLVQAVKILKKTYDVLVISPVDGPLKQQYLNEDISVIIDPMLYDSNNWLFLAADFDIIFVNTVVPYKSIEQLRKLDRPVIWWLHDSRFGYRDWLRFVLPNNLTDNIHTYAVSSYAKQVVLDYRPNYHVDILPYGLADVKKEHDIQTTYSSYISRNKVVFSNIGQIMWRKGQDVLIKAIKLLDENTFQKCCFIFVGGIIDKNIYKEILEMKQLFPDNIIYIEKIPHENMNDLYKQTDVVVCSSRDDPLPTFITEALINSVICICSENTGFNGLFKSGVNGFLYKNDSEEELAQIISYIVNNIGQMQDIRDAGYILYKQYLSLEAFEEKLLSIVDRV